MKLEKLENTVNKGRMILMKCRNCGNIDNTVNTTIHTTGVLNNSYYCPKCKNMQEVQIEAISEYK